MAGIARRFWARMLDWALCVGLWNACWCFIWPAALISQSGLWQIAQIVAGNVLMLLLEPLFLHFLGTTPGKWALGLRVEAIEGGLLSLEQARERTRGVLWHGMRLGLPGLQLIAMWKSARDAGQGTALKWEYDSAVRQKSTDRRRWALYIALRLLVAGVLVCCMGLGRIVPNRGELSTEQYAENYRFVRSLYAPQSVYTLNAQGEWVQAESDVVLISFAPEIDLQIDTAGGYVRGVTMRVALEAGEDGIILFLPGDRMTLAAMALGCAQSTGVQEMFVPTSQANAIAEFFGQLAIFGPPENGGTGEYTKTLEADGYRIEYCARWQGGAYATGDGDAAILPEDEGGRAELTMRIETR